MLKKSTAVKCTCALILAFALVPQVEAAAPYVRGAGPCFDRTSGLNVHYQLNLAEQSPGKNIDVYVGAHYFGLWAFLDRNGNWSMYDPSSNAIPPKAHIAIDLSQGMTIASVINHSVSRTGIMLPSILPGLQFIAGFGDSGADSFQNLLSRGQFGVLGQVTGKEVISDSCALSHATVFQQKEVSGEVRSYAFNGSFVSVVSLAPIRPSVPTPPPPSDPIDTQLPPINPSSPNTSQALKVQCRQIDESIAGAGPSVNGAAVRPKGPIALPAGRIDAHAVSSEELAITWKMPFRTTDSVKISRKIATTGAWTQPFAVAGGSNFCIDADVEPGQSYDYRIEINGNASSKITKEIRANIPRKTGRPTLYYVDACNFIPGNADAGNGSKANPWKTLQSAANNLTAGDTVLVRNRKDCSAPTVYKTAPNANGRHRFAVLEISNSGKSLNDLATGGPRSGTPTSWITYRNYPGETPLIETAKGGSTSASAGNYHGISIRNASYIVIDGFQIAGHLGQISTSEASQLNANFRNEFRENLVRAAATPPLPALRNHPITAILDSSGITVGKGDQGPEYSMELTHHVIVRNNVIHDHPGGGINSLFSDYVVFENNSVNNVSWLSPYGASALNMFRSKDVEPVISQTVPVPASRYDGSKVRTDIYKMVINGNIALNTGNLFPCECASYKKATDGNGLILDQLARDNGPYRVKNELRPGGVLGNYVIPIDDYFLPAYRGRTLIVNNVIGSNGARGVHVFQSSKTDVINNTIFKNGTQKGWIYPASYINAITEKLDSNTIDIAEGDLTSVMSSQVGMYNNLVETSQGSAPYLINFGNTTLKNKDQETVEAKGNAFFGEDSAAASVRETNLTSVIDFNGGKNSLANPVLKKDGNENLYLTLGRGAIDAGVPVGGVALWHSSTLNFINPFDKDFAGFDRRNGTALDVGAREH